MYYLSHYNSYISKPEKILVYNTKYQNVVEFEETNLEAVQNFMKNEPTQELIDMGFVTENAYEVEEEKSRFLQVRFNKEQLNIMLIMTYECNCKCEYCFENLNSSFLNNEKTDLKGTVEYIINTYQQGGYKVLELHFFGGEPTMDIDGMVYVIDELKKAKINVKPDVITNGVLLNEEKIRKLEKAGILSCQITLDGPKHIHDKRRPARNETSAWDSIIKNLEILCETPISTTIRINVDKENVSYLKEICDGMPRKFIENKNSVVYIAPIVGCMTKNTAVETLQERAQTLKTAWNIIEKQKLPIQIQPPVYYPCPNDSFESAFYLDLYGNIYNCGGFVGKCEKIERTTETKTEAFYRRNLSMPHGKCFECEFGPICFGGCKFEEYAIGAGCQYQYLKEVYDEYYQKYVG